MSFVLVTSLLNVRNSIVTPESQSVLYTAVGLVSTLPPRLPSTSNNQAQTCSANCKSAKNFFFLSLQGYTDIFSEVWDSPRQKINHSWLGDKCLGRQKQLTTTFIIQTLTCSSGCILGTIIFNIQHVQTSSCNCINAYIHFKVV